eukprot:gnl/TRDRNA2_/TRDRNA2_33374_c0_seq1.p1 gnl/TRDRNA2_/TRDRNA2_33374_c0~~gnl/TRDRNA2_/TRDRNA2_33374_c0_seq1.p1  ORF type:complete len:512 (+),score=44.20 gnl/TRDRNA2_/TRDRNA2_33374_c0_seq1:111-1646(+)
MMLVRYLASALFFALSARRCHCLPMSGSDPVILTPDRTRDVWFQSHGQLMFTSKLPPYAGLNNTFVLDPKNAPQFLYVSLRILRIVHAALEEGQSLGFGDYFDLASAGQNMDWFADDDVLVPVDLHFYFDKGDLYSPVDAAKRHGWGLAASLLIKGHGAVDARNVRRSLQQVKVSQLRATFADKLHVPEMLLASDVNLLLKAERISQELYKPPAEVRVTKDYVVDLQGNFTRKLAALSFDAKAQWKQNEKGNSVFTWIFTGAAVAIAMWVWSRSRWHQQKLTGRTPAKHQRKGRGIPSDEKFFGHLRAAMLFPRSFSDRMYTAISASCCGLAVRCRLAFAFLRYLPDRVYTAIAASCCRFAHCCRCRVVGILKDSRSSADLSLQSLGSRLNGAITATCKCRCRSRDARSPSRFGLHRLCVVAADALVMLSGRHHSSPVPVAPAAQQAGPEQEEPQVDCVICLTDPRTHVIVPCGHYCLCEGCAKRMIKGSKASWICPMCRKQFSNCIRVYQ